MLFVSVFGNFGKKNNRKIRINFCRTHMRESAVLRKQYYQIRIKNRHITNRVILTKNGQKVDTDQGR